MKAIPKGLKYPTEACRYLARDGFYYRDILSSPDSLRKDAHKSKFEYVQFATKERTERKK